MKKLLFLLLICLSLAGCSSPVDSRLAEADSLLCTGMQEKAFAILKSVSPGSLHGRGNRAYYALLYTQAQYKCYEPIRSDSLIDIAVDYYDGSDDYDKHLRSLIYKGAALSDMGDRLEAADWYKKAEETADTADYDNLGYINLRLASLYGESFIENDEHITKLKKAIDYFHKARNKEYELMCMSRLGAFYRAIDLDTAKYYLDNAVKFSKELNDSSSYFYNLGMLARLYGMDSLYRKEKDIAIYVVNNGSKYLNDFNPYYDAAEAYAMLGNLDSAYFYFNKIVRDKFNANDSVVWLSTLNKLERRKGDYKSAFLHYSEMKDIAYSIYKKSMQEKLWSAEKKYDTQRLERENAQLKNHKLILYLTVLLVLILLLSIWIVSMKRKNKIREQFDIISQLQNDSKFFELELSNKSDCEVKLKSILSEQFEKIKYLIDLSYQLESKPELFIKRFREFIKKTKMPNNLWSDFIVYVNIAYNNVIDKIAKLHPQLKDEELYFISLICCGFSYIEIAICMGYTNNNYVNNKKVRIAKKIGITMSLKEYINQIIASN
ncbi:MAG: hypothetical protein IAB88_01675 [Bacteroidetes bacterium]|uniref:Tetratricopeptide repeat protein n=1 Tax=Candidatus Limisoma faecipullorum TaxID=2840854 RepID=A0A9D9IPB4_9BACT|nr:hypothetical protein [Candidatus Limisoma faecipullorum]